MEYPKYFVVETNTLLKLIEKVQTFLDQGWKLQGGVSTGVQYGTSFYIQALVKEQK